MPVSYNSTQLDALGELANIGSGTAATALSQMVGTSVDLEVSAPVALPLADAVDRAGVSDSVVTAVVVPLRGELAGMALILLDPNAVNTLSELLGVEAGTDIATSALGEIGNILCSSYLGALATMTGLQVEPGPPQLIVDTLGAVLASALLEVGDIDETLHLESRLQIDGKHCALQFLLLPAGNGATEILSRIGLAS